jgi:hypothetical protein
MSGEQLTGKEARTTSQTVSRQLLTSVFVVDKLHVLRSPLQVLTPRTVEYSLLHSIIDEHTDSMLKTLLNS